ncbi:hypothetical protein GA0061093_107162 [Rhodococcus qingshengii]|nr:hypothetical protein GA0061093_107162 [Rhodococcus qingshengii]
MVGRGWWTNALTNTSLMILLIVTNELKTVKDIANDGVAYTCSPAGYRGLDTPRKMGYRNRIGPRNTVAYTSDAYTSVIPWGALSQIRCYIGQ